MSTLESTHGGFCFRSEIPDLLDSELRLNLAHQIALVAATQRRTTDRSARLRRRLSRRNRYWSWNCSCHDGRNRGTERVHIKVRIGLATPGRRVFLVSSAKASILSDARQNGGHAALISIHLHFRPW